MTQERHAGCKPVRPKLIEAVGAAAGTASRNSERGEAQDKDTLKMDEDVLDEQLMAEKNMDSEEEREMFGPSSEEEGPVLMEGQDARRVARPPQPTKEDVLQHELAHIPFRSWCQHCIPGKSRNPPTP